MSPCLLHRPILSMVFSLILMERHCIFSNLLGPCYYCYADSNPIFWVGAFYPRQYTATRPNGGEVSLEIIRDSAVVCSQFLWSQKFSDFIMESASSPIPLLYDLENVVYVHRLYYMGLDKAAHVITCIWVCWGSSPYRLKQYSRHKALLFKACSFIIIINCL